MSREKQNNTPTNTPTQNQFTNSELKQVEEIFKDLCDAPTGCVKNDFTISTLKDSHTDLFICTAAGHIASLNYRKQSEGEWKLHKDGSGTCSECHFIQKDIWDYDHYQHFCGHCGAKMKGGAE